MEQGPVTNASQTHKAALREAIDQLTLPEQRVLSMRVKSASVHEIAQELRISTAEAHRTLRRTLEKVQEIIPPRMEHPIQADEWSSLVDILVESQDLETIFDESLAEIDEIRSRMNLTQLEIDRHKETTRNIIGQLGF